MIARLILALALLTSPAMALSCAWPTPEERADKVSFLIQGASETETLVSGVFSFDRVLTRSREHGDETLVVRWTFEGTRYFQGRQMQVSMPVLADFWCWQTRCSRDAVRPKAVAGVWRLSRETSADPWRVNMGECSSDSFSPDLL